MKWKDFEDKWPAVSVKYGNNVIGYFLDIKIAEQYIPRELKLKVHYHIFIVDKKMNKKIYDTLMKERKILFQNYR